MLTDGAQWWACLKDSNTLAIGEELFNRNLIAKELNFCGAKHTLERVDDDALAGKLRKEEA